MIYTIVQFVGISIDKAPIVYFALAGTALWYICEFSTEKKKDFLGELLEELLGLILCFAAWLIVSSILLVVLWGLVEALKALTGNEYIGAIATMIDTYEIRMTFLGIILNITAALWALICWRSVVNRWYQKWHKKRLKEEEAEKELRQAKEAKEEAQRQADLEERKRNADNFKDNVKKLSKQFVQNLQNAKKTTELSFEYKSVELQGKLWEAVNDASIQLQKIDDIVAEVNAEKEEK